MDAKLCFGQQVWLGEPRMIVVWCARHLGCAEGRIASLEEKDIEVVILRGYVGHSQEQSRHRHRCESHYSPPSTCRIGYSSLPGSFMLS